ncbi:MAG: hypothetical protein GWN01_01885 [Nitrosopumilaceae archaeon]|nr:hypothetical protein [Nitrosopumilaceae archaeon]NIT99723.1 hypothetical protein [Nitrosopumilaceae archaeon]NIU88584.1 hypothetical protein [Nitrosopumilaceae archaeon]NIV64858.1 hypothetical protein [Nitrosopumilaceae archaeon]NIX60326.1 hypothetical protein [Nitrosopumilaceae archaeon]
MKQKDYEKLHKILFAILSVLVVYTFFYISDANAILLVDAISITSEEQKTVESIERFYRHVLDDSFSDKFIEKISGFAVDTVYYSYFSLDNDDPLSWLRTMEKLSPEKYIAFETVWQTDRSQKYWINKQGIVYEKNDYDDFKRITPIHANKDCPEKWQVMTRNHCDFDEMKELENYKAKMHLRAYHSNVYYNIPFAEINNTFAYDRPEVDSRTKFLLERGMYDWIKLGEDYQ